MMSNFGMWVRVATSVAAGSFAGVYAALHIANLSLSVVLR